MDQESGLRSGQGSRKERRIRKGKRMTIRTKMRIMTRIKGLRQDSPIDGSNSKIVSGVGEKSIEGARRLRCLDPFA